ncbi:MAG TPA: hypothetical protein VFW05_00235 [Verrucomicrobiae bacterium]|nr:hypothetical protein [Verrucomicrobiae bacterium]
MSAHSIEPLRKTNAEGVLYTRLPATEEMLSTLQSLSPKERGKRCAIDDKDSSYDGGVAFFYLIGLGIILRFMRQGYGKKARFNMLRITIK